MKYKCLPAIVFLLFIQITLNGQHPDTATKVITISDTSITDCINQSDFTWLLDKKGTLYALETPSYSIKKTFSFQTKIVALAPDTSNHIIIADEKGTVSSINRHFDTTVLYNTGQKPIQLIVTNDNSVYLITEKGIYLPEFNRLFYEDAFNNSIVAHFNRYQWFPSCFYLDEDQNIWLGFDFGEWGGDIVGFSTTEKKFLSLPCLVRPVKSIFSINKKLAASISLQHMRLLNGKIITISDSCQQLFESEDSYDTSINVYKEQPLYMGPALYSTKDNSIYFYCQFGVFKCNLQKDISKLDNWELILETNLSWQYGMPTAVGYGMNVSKMFWANNKLILISPNNGVLIWDGNKKVLLK